MQKTVAILVALALVLLCAHPVRADEAGLRQELKKLAASQPSGWPGILKRIGGLMRQLHGAPLPEEFHRRMARGRAAVKSAGDATGFKRAADEFRQATRAAPWRPDAFYNLGIVQDKAGVYDAAMRNLRIYLAAVPDAEDAAQVRDLVYEIEYRKEQAARPPTPKTDPAAEARKRQQEADRKAAEERRRNEQTVASVLGRWQMFCGSRPTPMRLRPAGANQVTFEMWNGRAQPAHWGATSKLRYDARTRQFANAGRNLILTIAGANRLRYDANGYICDVSR